MDWKKRQAIADALLGYQSLTPEERHALSYLEQVDGICHEFEAELWLAGRMEPTTVPKLLDGDGSRRGHLKYYVSSKLTPRVRLIFMAEYLLNPVLEHLEVPSQWDTYVTRLEGELRRWQARETGNPVTSIVVTPRIVQGYCERYDLKELKSLMLQQLGIGE